MNFCPLIYKCSSLRSQCWMRLFLWFPNTVSQWRQKKLAKDVSTTVSIGVFKEDWTVWRLLIALYCQDWANASFRSSCSSTTEDYYPTIQSSSSYVSTAVARTFYASSIRDLFLFSFVPFQKSYSEMVFGRKDMNYRCGFHLQTWWWWDKPKFATSSVVVVLLQQL